MKPMAVSREVLAGTVAVLGFGIFFRYCSRRWANSVIESKHEEGASRADSSIHRTWPLRTRRRVSKNSEEISKEPEGNSLLEEPPPSLPLPVVEDDDAASTLELEVVSGPSAGAVVIQKAVRGAEARVILTIGRVSGNNLVLNDPEVSGSHAVITWNAKAAAWELVDLGSLNGTQLNSKKLVAPQLVKPGHRNKSLPMRIKDGDSVLLGTSNRVKVKVTGGQWQCHFAVANDAPFEVGLHADAMNARKGQELPMEDVSYCEWPLQGVEEFGMFCIFDGHCGRRAADAASRLIAAELSSALRVKDTRDSVLDLCDASAVLTRAFRRTEDALPMEDEGCTATVLLVWRHPLLGLFAQCANVGDSACYFSVEGKEVAMSQDHRVVNPLEKERLLKGGFALSDGETRLCGMNLARALGDKFLKAQNVGLSSEPNVSSVLRLQGKSDVIAIIASDGLWDVLTPKAALQLMQEIRRKKDPSALEQGNIASAMAHAIVDKARAYGTKDNTTAVALVFSSQ